MGHRYKKNGAFVPIFKISILTKMVLIMVYRLYSKDRVFFFYIKNSSYLCTDILK